MEHFDIGQVVERIVGSALGSLISGWINRGSKVGDQHECPECARRRKDDNRPPIAA